MLIRDIALEWIVRYLSMIMDGYRMIAMHSALRFSFCFVSVTFPFSKLS
jgi:hypothetical protein